jgi:hypothetical protein
MWERHRRPYWLLGQKLTPVGQLPFVSFFSSRAKTRAQDIARTKTSEDNDFRVASRRDSSNETPPFATVDLFDMGDVKKDRISESQIRFGNAVEDPVKARPPFLIPSPASGIGKEGVDHVIVIEVDGPQPSQNFFRQRGLSRTRHSHQQN